MKKLFAYSIMLILTTFMIAACSNSTDPGNEGRIKINLVDAPATLDSVIIDVVRVEVHKTGSGEEDGWIVVNEVNKKYDLLKLTNGASAVLGDAPLAVGKYTQVRLVLGTDNYLYDNGVKYNLTVPSGQQTGIKLNHNFDIEADNLYEFYLDFNADKSINITGTGEYKLSPVIRIEAVVTSGSISGQVLPLEAQAKVWTVAGTDTLTTYPDSLGNFKLVAVPGGTYNVYLTPAATGFQQKIINDVIVTPQTNTDLGTITLTP
ncbi:MAG: DUF4382 domain-containing protein [Syntrophothermus sp.]